MKKYYAGMEQRSSLSKPTEVRQMGFQKNSQEKIEVDLKCG